MHSHILVQTIHLHLYISKMGTALGPIATMMDTFDEILESPAKSSAHAVYSDEKDLVLMVTELHK